MLVDAGASPKGGALYAIVNSRNRVPLIGPRPSPTGDVTELELLAAMLATGVDLTDRPPQPLPDRDPGFGQIPTKPVDTALIRAARSADLDSLRLLIEAGADPTLREPDGLNAVLAVTAGPEIPPLTVVDRERPAEPDAIAALKFLLERGADVNATDGSASPRCTPLRNAVSSNVLRFLAAHGAALDAADRGGRTPLDYALGRSPAFRQAARERGGRCGAARARRARREPVTAPAAAATAAR